MCSGMPAWAQSPGAHLSFHTSPRLMCWRCFHVRAVHVKLPLETSMPADSRDYEGAFFTPFLSQPCWPGLPGLTRPRTEIHSSRTQGHCSSYNPMLHPDSPALTPHTPVAHPLTFLKHSQVSFLPVLPRLGKPWQVLCMYEASRSIEPLLHHFRLR